MKTITLPDDHATAITLLLDNLQQALPELFSEKGEKTVLHIGAHIGEEVPFYLQRGFTAIYLVEANPDLVSQLSQRYGNNPQIRVLSYAISDTSGPVEFTVHQTTKGSVESASLLPLQKLGEIVPVFNSEKKITVDAITLDALIEELRLDSSVDLLCLDIQGAELMALTGGELLLQSLKAVICEVNLIENYRGGALERDIADFLEQRNFTHCFTIYHELYDAKSRFPAWGEGLWIKPGIAGIN